MCKAHNTTLLKACMQHEIEDNMLYHDYVIADKRALKKGKLRSREEKKYFN